MEEVNAAPIVLPQEPTVAAATVVSIFNLHALVTVRNE
jgi:hypothetical protein